LVAMSVSESTMSTFVPSARSHSRLLRGNRPVRRLLEEAGVVRCDSFGDVGIADDTLSKEDLVSHAGAEVFPCEVRAVTVHRQFCLAAFFGFHPAPADVEGMALLGKGGCLREFGIEGRVGFESPCRVGVGEKEGITHGKKARSEIRGEGSIGVCQGAVHFLLRPGFARFAGGFREARIIDAIGPGLVDEQPRRGRVFGDGIGEPSREGLVGSRVVTPDAGLLDRHVVPFPREELVLEAASIRVEPGFVRGFGLVLLRPRRVQFEGGPAHDDGTANQGVADRLREVVEMVRRVAREAAADGEEMDGAVFGLGGEPEGEEDGQEKK